MHYLSFLYAINYVASHLLDVRERERERERSCTHARNCVHLNMIEIVPTIKNCITSNASVLMN